MIPIALITGFLGSGKTTLLRRMAGQYRERTVAFLVNEYAHNDVDGQRLAQDAPNVQLLPGGSIFCTCLVHEFIGVLDLLPKQFGDSLDAVVIEASGVANPAVIARLLHDARLDTTYTLRVVVSVVDPATFPALLQSLPNIAEQVRASDVVILNKRDLHDAETLDETERLVRTLRPEAPIHRAMFCEADIDLLELALPHTDQDGELADCKDPNYAATAIPVDTPMDLERLGAVLDENEEGVYRLKGHVPTKAGTWYVDYAGNTLRVEPAPAWSGPLELVLIGDGHQRDRLTELADAIARCAANT
ncbi:MAG: CobW family GTP-binding protein [Candidatus Hydrogenedentota bacterium]